MSKLAAMPLEDYKDICDAVREKTGSTEPIRSGELAGMILEIKDGDPYEGTYEVTPTVEGTVLPTAQKLLENDINVKPVPMYEVSNLAGGTTVYIAAALDE